MNNSIFLRIYGGMLAVLVLVALLGVLSLHLVNEVRAAQQLVPKSLSAKPLIQ